MNTQANNATTKQINFLMKLNPELKAEELNTLSVKDASIMIGKLLKQSKPNVRTAKKTTSKDVKNVEDLKLKSFTLITDDNERLSVIQNIYCCDITDCKNDPKTSKYYRDKLVLKTNDGKYITLADGKPSIENTMYYDDETPAPDENFENFKNYNLRYNFRNYDLTLNDEVIAKPNYAKTDNFYEITQERYTDRFGDTSNYIRNLTDDEKADIKKIIDFQKAQYIKRLETYWKKYSNKVTTYGYWANR